MGDTRMSQSAIVYQNGIFLCTLPVNHAIARSAYEITIHARQPAIRRRIEMEIIQLENVIKTYNIGEVETPLSMA